MPGITTSGCIQIALGWHHPQQALTGEDIWAEGPEPNAQQGQAALQQQPWKSGEADAAGKARVLEWGGLARASATWQRRYLCLYRGRLYCLEKRSAAQDLAQQVPCYALMD